MSTSENWTDDFGTTIERLHPKSRCSALHCVIHNPSNHHMRHMPQKWNADRGFIERVCEHETGHPDPDIFTHPRTHGCDGCCDYETYTKDGEK
jgi:hypothetical protein